MLYRCPGATAGGLAVAPEITDSESISGWPMSAWGLLSPDSDRTASRLRPPAGWAGAKTRCGPTILSIAVVWSISSVSIGEYRG
ncbi:hypothetical protein CYV19_00535 [Natronobacterium gregoryi SP2]|uniref:Uncharacterized protein n=1 Tax=Natronobacterium gregoryi (strain ATCC 43098 / DSM 3393 / CCM 3738 / CIP 104747 / IAM 13177 / JCM 8860 / NBRC 102187 / NCIMB 2189 / SP2) TaxID=797304 RepID=A0A2J4JJV2_NATGS|nr:hypothetical protein CYV19_00535 [Natronobacterium gregoryi SP2]